MKNSPTETFKHGIAKPVLPAVFSVGSSNIEL